MALLIVAFAMAISSAAAQPLHPIIFTGGVGASMLQADLNKTTSPHWYCETQAKDYDLWLYYRNLAPFKSDCWIDNMMLRWEDGEMKEAGIKINLLGDHLSAGDDIKNGYPKDLWGDLLSGVNDLGYSGTHPRVSALHYDWRLSLDQLMNDGTFAKMKGQIETRVAAADGKPAVLVSLSYGGPLLHKFLAKFVDAAWKQKYVERWISLSGVFGGTVELTRMAFYPEALDFFNIPEYLPYISLEKSRDMSNTFASSFTLRPTFLRDDEVLVSANIAGKQHNYTKQDIPMALEDSGLSAARQVYESSAHAYSFDQLDSPGVTVDCIYGTSDNTIDGVHFGNGFNKPATTYTYEDGDGVAPTRSLSLCAQWNSTKASDSHAPKVSVYTFPHIGHGGTLHSQVAVQRFSEIVHSLYDPAGRSQSSEYSLIV